jgi:hypothetical protein
LGDFIDDWTKTLVDPMKYGAGIDRFAALAASARQPAQSVCTSGRRTASQEIVSLVDQ